MWVYAVAITMLVLFALVVNASVYSPVHFYNDPPEHADCPFATWDEGDQCHMCPLTHDCLPADYVKTASKHCFDRAALLRWVQAGNRTNPVSRAWLQDEDYVALGMMPPASERDLVEQMSEAFEEAMGGGEDEPSFEEMFVERHEGLAARVDRLLQLLGAFMHGVRSAPSERLYRVAFDMLSAVWSVLSGDHEMLEELLRFGENMEVSMRMGHLMAVLFADQYIASRLLPMSAQATEVVRDAADVAVNMDPIPQTRESAEYWFSMYLVHGYLERL